MNAFRISNLKFFPMQTLVAINQILYVFLSFFRYKKFILDEMAKQKMNNEHRLGHSIGKKKTYGFSFGFSYSKHIENMEAFC